MQVWRLSRLRAARAHAHSALAPSLCWVGRQIRIRALPNSLVHKYQERHRCAALRRRFPRRAQPRWPARAGAPPSPQAVSDQPGIRRSARRLLGAVILAPDGPAHGHRVNGGPPRAVACDRLRRPLTRRPLPRIQRLRGRRVRLGHGGLAWPIALPPSRYQQAMWPETARDQAPDRLVGQCHIPGLSACWP